MKKFLIWNKQTPLIYNNGVKKTPEEVFEDYPKTKYGTVIIEYTDDNVNMNGFWTPSELKAVYKLDSDLTDKQTITAAEDAVNNPPPPSDDITPVTQSQVQLLGQLLNELNLNILEMGNT